MYPKVPYEEVTSKTGVKIDSNLMIRFDEYLGFFELLSNLWGRTKFDLKDIGGTFGYYLVCLRERPEIWNYLSVPVFGFDTTRELYLSGLTPYGFDIHLQKTRISIGYTNLIKMHFKREILSTRTSSKVGSARIMLSLPHSFSRVGFWDTILFSH